MRSTARMPRRASGRQARSSRRRRESRGDGQVSSGSSWGCVARRRAPRPWRVRENPNLRRSVTQARDSIGVPEGRICGPRASGSTSAIRGPPGAGSTASLASCWGDDCSARRRRQQRRRESHRRTAQLHTTGGVVQWCVRRIASLRDRSGRRVRRLWLPQPVRLSAPERAPRLLDSNRSHAARIRDGGHAK